MRLPLKDIALVFKEICKKVVITTGLVIIASGDCDSVCAVHILKTMLKA